MDIVASNVNTLFAKKEPWQIVAITTTTTLLVVWFYEFLHKEESACSQLQKLLQNTDNKIHE